MGLDLRPQTGAFGTESAQLEGVVEGRKDRDGGVTERDRERGREGERERERERTR